MRDVLGWIAVAVAAAVFAYLVLTVPPSDQQQEPAYIEHLVK